MKSCAYCGKTCARYEKEHVFPRCLYPPSKTRSKTQRLTVPACNECNNSWADDEAHFRNMLVLAGEQPNTARQELWQKAQRSFDQVDGARRIGDIIARMKRIDTPEGPGHLVFPGRDERVLRVVRKVIRGLCYYHSVSPPVSDRRVWADVLKYEVPPALLEQMQYEHRDKEIVEYRYRVLDDADVNVNSAWLITFFERVTFVGAVSVSDAGFQ
jgi:hypothetical protein